MDVKLGIFENICQSGPSINNMLHLFSACFWISGIKIKFSLVIDYGDIFLSNMPTCKINYENMQENKLCQHARKLYLHN